MGGLTDPDAVFEEEIVKYRVVRQFAANIDPQREDVYRVETAEMMTQREAVALMRRLDAPGQLRSDPAGVAALVVALYDAITTPGAVPSFDADVVIGWTITKLLAMTPSP